jgi:hypothetical protein
MWRPRRFAPEPKVHGGNLSDTGSTAAARVPGRRSLQPCQRSDVQVCTRCCPLGSGLAHLSRATLERGCIRSCVRSRVSSLAKLATPTEPAVPAVRVGLTAGRRVWACVAADAGWGPWRARKRAFSKSTSRWARLLNRTCARGGAHPTAQHQWACTDRQTDRQ